VVDYPVWQVRSKFRFSHRGLLQSFGDNISSVAGSANSGFKQADRASIVLQSRSVQV
jgi:hypothetical protein